MGPGVGWTGFPDLMSPHPQDLCYHLLYGTDPPGHHLPEGLMKQLKTICPQTFTIYLQLRALTEVRQASCPPPIAFSAIIVSPCYLSSPICDTRKKVTEPWLFLFA